jgi:glutaredoxin-like YruB-family protein
MEIKVYSTPTCGYCHQVKKYLTDRGIKYTEYDVSRDQNAANEMVKLTGQSGVPVIAIGGQVIVGFDRVRLEQLLASTPKTNGKNPSFGLSVANASKVVYNFGDDQIFGAFVGKVAPLSLGQKLGLKKGDIINIVNSKPVQNVDELENALATLSKGDRVAIGYIRNKKPYQSEIVI